MPIARDDFEINQFLLLTPCPLGALYNFPENLTLSAAVFSSREQWMRRACAQQAPASNANPIGMQIAGEEDIFISTVE
jgi:hypothetical protein